MRANTNQSCSRLGRKHFTATFLILTLFVISFAAPSRGQDKPVLKDSKATQKKIKAGEEKPQLKKTATKKMKRDLSFSEVTYQKNIAAVGKELAQEMAHVFHLTAADPDTEFPPNSFAAKIQKIFLNIGKEKQELARVEAIKIFQKPDSLQARIFGNYALKKASFYDSAIPHSISSNRDRIQNIGKQYVAMQLKQQQEIQKKLKKRMAGDVSGDRLPDAPKLNPGAAQKSPLRSLSDLRKTKLEVGLWSDPGDLDPIVLGDQYIMDDRNDPIEFKWYTLEEEAEIANWELLNAAQEIVARGSAGHAPGDIFTIDFSSFLPEDPPPEDEPLVYTLRVRTYIDTDKYTEIPGDNQFGKYTDKKTKKLVGFASNAVTITYCDCQEEFKFPPIHYCYRDMYFTFGTLHIVEEESEWDGNEFWIDATITEYRADAVSGHQERINIEDHYCDPESGHKEIFSFTRGPWNLPYPTAESWPRTFLCTFSILESDDEGMVNDFLAATASAAWEMLAPEIQDIMAEVLAELLKEVTAWAIDAMGFAANGAWVSLINPIAGAIVSIAMEILGDFIGDIIACMADDYYGTQTMAFILPFADCEFIRSLPGRPIIDTKKWGPGWVLQEKQSEFFYGPDQTGDDPYDGIVKVGFNYYFCNVEEYYRPAPKMKPDAVKKSKVRSIKK